jgi:hypothetical protein
MFKDEMYIISYAFQIVLLQVIWIYRSPVMSKLLNYFCMLRVAKIADGLFVCLFKHDWVILDA